MPERKAWTSQQDKTLKHLRQELQINKWSIIAKKMTDQYDMPGRTGKQCRERYHNHLDSNILRTEWTKQEQQNLYNLHDEIGNKWAIIAQKLPGRTDNCVKNHFYSRMRKAIRKLNKTIHQNFKRDYREIKMPVLYKIVEATDQKFKSNTIIDEEISQKCCSIKNLLLTYSNDDNNPLEGDLEKLRQLSNDIHDFSFRYKRKQKKQKRNSQHVEQFIQLPRFQHKGKTTSDQASGQDQYSMAFSKSCKSYDADESSQEKSQTPLPTINKLQFPELKQQLNKIIIEPQPEQRYQLQKNKKIFTIKVPTILPKVSFNMQEQPEKVQQLLKQQGILQQNPNIVNTQIIRTQQLKRQDSYSLLFDQQGRSNNMLSQSVEEIKIPNTANLGFSVEIDDQNKLFGSC